MQLATTWTGLVWTAVSCLFIAAGTAIGIWLGNRKNRP